MPIKRRNFSRAYGQASYRRLFLISCEGAITEPQYFAFFNSEYVTINCLYEIGKSAPNQVLKRMKATLDKTPLRDGDETWLVVDKDRWTDAQLDALQQWVLAEDKVSRGLALSNPKFEYWLLLHFAEDDGAGDYSRRLGQYLPGYNKCLDMHVFNLDKIKAAIDRAKQRDNPPCVTWPQSAGTTVYRLVQNIISSNEPNDTCAG